MMHAIPELDDRGLRSFGLTTAAIVVVVFGLLLPWLFEFAWPRWPWIVAAVLVVPALVAPRLLNPVYRVWMRFGLMMNRIVTPVIMGIVFYLMVLPIGLVLRAVSGDPMRRKAEPQAPSYRETCDAGRGNDMEKPY